MKIDLSPEEIALVIRALRHQFAYLHSQQRDDSRYEQLASRLEKASR